MKFLARFALAVASLASFTIPTLLATNPALDAGFVSTISPGLTPLSYPDFASGASVGTVNALALLSDGKILVGGNISRYKTSGDLSALKRLLPTGALDTSFNPAGAGLANGTGQPEVKALLVDSSDRTYVGGDFTSYNGTPRSGILRLLADGTLDASYAPAGLAGTSRYAQTLALQPDGKLLVGGAYSTINGTFRQNVARLLPTGAIDPDFNPAVSGSVIKAIAVQPDGKIIVAGNSSGQHLLARLYSDGSLDASFVPALAPASSTVDQALLLPDGRLIISGFLTLPSGVSADIAALRTDGSLDTTFQTNIGEGPNGYIGYALRLQPDGTILAAGVFNSWNGQPRVSVASLNPDGTLRDDFAPLPYSDDRGQYGTHFYSLAVQPDGKLVVGGWFSRVTDPTVETYNLTRFVNAFAPSSPGAIRLLSATATTAENAGSITLQVSRFGGTAGAVSVQFATSTGGASGTAAAASDYTTTTGTLSWAANEGGFKTITVPVLQDTAVELSETFTVTLSSPTGGATLPTASAKTLVTIRDDDSLPAITRDPASVSLEQGASFTLSVRYDSVLAATVKWQRDPDGAGPLGFSDLLGAEGISYTVAVADPLIHAGTYRAVATNANGFANSTPATVSISVPAGSVVNTTSSVTFTQAPLAATLDALDRPLVLITGTSGSAPARLHRLVRGTGNPAPIQTDSTFTPATFTSNPNSGAPGTVAALADGKILVGGLFGQVNDTPRASLARLLSTGALDTTFNPVLPTIANGFTITSVVLAPSSGGKLYAGFDSNGGLRRYLADGTLDPAFGPNTNAAFFGPSTNINNSVTALLETPDGHLYVAHRYSSQSFGGTLSYPVWRLKPDGTRDTTFADPAAAGVVTSLALLPDGRLALGGHFPSINGQALTRLALVQPDGKLDPGFYRNPNFPAGVRQLFYRDGRLLAFGEYEVSGATPRALRRYNLDGGLDASFAVGDGANSRIAGTAFTSTGEIFLAGSFTQVKGVARDKLAYLVGNPHIGAVGFTPSRRIEIERGEILSLTLHRYGPATEAISLRYATADADTTSLPSSITTATAGADYLGASGTVSWAAGDTADKTVSIQLFNDATVESTKTFRVLLSNPSGPVSAASPATVHLLDDDTPATFTAQPTPTSTLGAGAALSLSATVTSPTPVSYQWFRNGVAIPGATSATYAKTLLTAADAGLYTLAATNSAGTVTSSPAHIIVSPVAGKIFPGQATAGRPAFTSAPFAIVPLNDGGALVGGAFNINVSTHVPQDYLIRVRADGSTDTSFTLAPSSAVTALLRQPDGKILVTGNFFTFGGTSTRYLARLNADLTLDTAFNTAVGTTISTSLGGPTDLALDSTGRIYVSLNNNSLGGAVLRLSPSGVIDSAYTVFTSSTFGGAGVTTLAIQPDDRLILAGNFMSVTAGGQPAVAKNRLARLATNGVVDAAFSPAVGSFPFNDLLVTPTGRIFAVGGTGGGNSNLFEVNPDGSATVFGLSSGNQLYQSAFGPDGRLALARASSGGSGSIFRLNLPATTGTGSATADTTFQVGAGPNGDVRALAYAADGSLWLAGQFTNFDGFASGGVVRLQGSVGDPGIVNPPVRVDANPGTTARLSVGAIGTNLSYQWFKNGVALSNDTRISGATTAILAISGLTLSDADTYTVTVTGGTPSTTLTSSGARLNVLGSPTVAASPASATPALGSTITLAADVLAATPATYRWTRGGVPLIDGGRYSGTTTGTLVITGANASDNGAYTLTVTNGLGTVSTTPATITVAQVATDRDPATTALGIPGTNFNHAVNDILHLPDGRTLLALNTVSGGFNGANSTNTSANLVIVNPDRTVAATPAGNFNNSVLRLFRQPDGKILAVGSFTQVGSTTRNRIARLNADLTLDTTFAPVGLTGSSSSINISQVFSDSLGRVYLSGNFATYGGVADYNFIVRLDATTGALDLSFKPQLNGFATHITKLPDGRFLLAGSFTHRGPLDAQVTVPPLLRLSTDGNFDFAYAPAITVTSPNTATVEALAVDPTGRTFVAQRINTTTGQIFAVRRLLENGTVDSTFTFDASTLNGSITAFAPLPSGKLICAGAFTTPGNRLLRLHSDGTLDNSYNLGTGLNSGGVSVLAPDALGRLWIGGTGFTTFQGTAAGRLLVLEGEGAPSLGFTQQPVGLVRDLGATATFTAAATGNNGFTYAWRKNGQPLADSTRISGSTTPSLTITGLLATDAAAYTLVVTAPSGASTFTNVTSGAAQLTVLAAPEITVPPAALTRDLGASATFNAFARGAATLTYRWLHGSTELSDGTVSGVTITGATTPSLTVSGLTFAQAGEYRLRVTNSLGSATTQPAVLTVERRPGGLAPGVAGTLSANNAVLAILRLQDGSMLVGGQFTSILVNGVGQTRNRLARFLSDGTLDPSFTPSFNGDVRALAQDSSGRIFVGGNFTSVTFGTTTTNRTRVARLTSVLALDTSFDTSVAGPNSSINAVAPTNDGGVYVGGASGFNLVGTATVNRIARLTATGALDTGFSAPTNPVNNEVKALLRRTDGKLYVGGTFGTTLLSAVGVRDTAFNAEAPSILAVQGQALLQLPSGELILGANAALPQPYLRRLNANTGASLTDFATGHGNQISALALQADGKVLSGAIGSFKRSNPVTGADDTGFSAFNNTISALAVDGAGRIWVGGSFTSYGSVVANRLAVLTGGEPDFRDGLLLPHSLTFTDIPDRTFGDTNNTFPLAATSDRSLSPITYSVISGPATITGSTLTVTGAGSITVEAAQAGNSTIRAATARQSFTVAKATQTVTFAALADKTTSSAPFTVSATASSGLPVTFSVTGEATLSTDGVTVVLSGIAGSATVTATQVGDANFNPASLSRTFNVTAGTPQTITFNAPADRLATAAPFVLSATATSGLPVAFAIVSGPATLGTDGKTLTLTGAGTITIRATQPGGDRVGVTYAPAPAVTQSFVSQPVPPKPQTITFAQPAPRTFGTAPAPLVATASSRLPVTFEIVSSTPASIATLGTDGKTLTLLGAGTVKLRATQPGGPGFSAAPSIERDLTVNKAPQTLAFTVPTTLALSTTPLILSGTATPSGLPVAFTVVSGPATLEGATLRFTGTGPVKLRATQPGDANYLAAKPLEKTITVTSTAALILADRTTTYNGEDQEATVTGVPPGFEDELVVTYNGSLTLPRNAGSYTVAASLGALKKTAKLTINKAPLAVSFDDRVRLVAQPNPTFFEPLYTGFVPGDTAADLAPTRPVGSTTAKLSSAQGDYPITFKGGLDKNYRYVPGAPAFLTIIGYGGTYEALLVDGASTPVGKLTLAVSKTTLGYSGTLNLARETTAIVVTSVVKPPSATTPLVASEDLSSATATWVRTTAGLDSLSLTFTVNTAGQLTGALTRNGERFATLASGRLLYAPPAKTLIPWAGQHTLALHSAFVTFPVNEGPFPRGSGVATAVVSSINGNLVLTGKLADGTTLTATLKPWITHTEDGALDQVGYVTWLTPYGTRTESFLAGSLTLQPHPEPTRFGAGSRHIPSDAGLLHWKKAGNAKDVAYRTGFGPLSVSVSLDPWLRPVVAKPPVVAITLPQRLGLVDNNTTAATLTISHGPEEIDLGELTPELPFAATLHPTTSITATNALTITGPSVNIAKWKLSTLNPATGAFTGSFILSDQAKPLPAAKTPRTVIFTGTLRQAPADEGDVLVGTGFFLVPALPVPPGTPVPEQPSGELRISAPATVP